VCVWHIQYIFFFQDYGERPTEIDRVASVFILTGLSQTRVDEVTRAFIKRSSAVTLKLFAEWTQGVPRWSLLEL